MNPEEKDPVWKLLESSRSAEVRPMFMKDVLREVRNLDSSSTLSDRLRGWFTIPRLAITGAVAAVIVALVVNFGSSNDPLPPVANGPDKDETPLKTVVVDDELEAKISDLDYFEELIAEDVSGLNDEELVALLY